MTGPAGLLDMAAAAALSALDRAGRRRVLRAYDRDGIRLRLPDGRVLVDVASNDYLGLAQDPGIIDRAAEFTARYGAGSGASRLVCGTLTAHREVEEKLAAFLGTEAALLIGTGYQANATLPAALAELLGGDVDLLVDRLAHASLLQGCFGQGLKARRFRHNDLDHLEDLLRTSTAAARMVVTELVFSMDGDAADLGALLDLADRHGAPVYLDEAHAIGVLGPQGRGLAAHFPGRVAVTMGTLGKAFGGFGAYVAGSRLLIDYLVNRCGGVIYTTAPPPAVLGALDAALDVMPSLDMERMRLAGMGDAVRMAVRGAGYDTAASSTQIIPVIAGAEQAALDLQALLEQAGFLAVAIRPPTVPAGTARLRLSLSSALDDQTVGQLLGVLTCLPPRGMDGVP
ncbi:aminotransferase class I/II-fold pyridoxal phosphate-dependent enzyme [Niveispirillum fermenti]|uniref:aminotransferase class I/II-fold pyridoxal phosphate-dependent enzyme n=1 Tax=Niveispirillum fermenti TaxID=1233113 RepID=UPI0040431581